LTDFVDPYCWPGSSVLRNLLELKTHRVTPSTTADEEPTAMLCRGGCGRALTAPRSIARGFGASCWKKRNG
jgi:hypothetical protein